MQMDPEVCKSLSPAPRMGRQNVAYGQQVFRSGPFFVLVTRNGREFPSLTWGSRVCLLIPNSPACVVGAGESDTRKDSAIGDSIFQNGDQFWVKF